VFEQAESSEQLTQNGYVVVERFAVGTPSEKAFAFLGKIDSIEGLGSVQTLKPFHKDQALPNTYSGNFGTLEFPLHTDLAHWAQPPRFLALRCIRGATSVATQLLDGNSIIETLSCESLRKALVQPRRPLLNRRQLLRLAEPIQGSKKFILRWDGLFLTPASRCSEIIFEEVSQFLSREPTIDVHLKEPGDTLIIDNWRMLHGRSSIPENASQRQIDRAYLVEVL
jgi:L-asparagine oxygenase